MTTDAYGDSDPETVADTVADAARSGDTVVLFATCEVNELKTEQ